MTKITGIDKNLWNALYARQSLDKKDSISIEMQLEKARALFPEEDLFKEYVDKGFSGGSMKRPSFQQMMGDIKRNLIKRVIVYRIDRFSRSLLDFCDTWAVMAKHGVEFVSVNERFDTSTPMGKAMLFILMVFAQLERETIAERVKDNYFARSGLGEWPGGEAPTGFDIVKVVEFARKFTSLMTNQYMGFLEEGFRQYGLDPTKSLTYIGNFLVEKGVPGEWSNTALSRLFRNPAYVKADEAVYYYFQAKGIKIVNDISEFDGEHAVLYVGKTAKEGKQSQISVASWKGVIESNIWLACQRKMEANQGRKNNGSGKYTWLTGLLKCGYCGKAMSIYQWQRKHGIYQYFTCSRRKKCSYNGMYPKLVEIEQEVSRQIIELFQDCKMREKRVDDKTEEIKNELALNEQKLENFLQVIGEGASAITIQYINAQIEALNRNKIRLMEQLAEVHERVSSIKIPRIAFPDLSFEEKKIVTASVIQRIKVFENKIEVEWKI